MERREELIRVDRNGTRHLLVVEDCPRCNGRGYIPGMEHVDGAICFKCNGSRVWRHKEAIMTPEHRAKLDAAALKRWRKKFADANGFSEVGRDEFETHVACGETYSIKEQLKEAGFVWDSLIGWHSPSPHDGIMTMAVNFDDVVMLWHGLDYGKCVAIREKAAAMARPGEPKPSSPIGEEGGKISIDVAFVNVSDVIGHDWMSGEEQLDRLYTFRSGDDVLQWRTHSLPRELEDASPGDEFSLSARVKKHVKKGKGIVTWLKLVKAKKKEL